VIAEHRPVDADVIQHIHHLTARERLTVDDRCADRRRRQIVATERHDNRGPGALEPAQHRRRTTQPAVTAAFDRVNFIDIIDMENGDRRFRLSIDVGAPTAEPQQA
jgi:hypothetical protein